MNEVAVSSLNPGPYVVDALDGDAYLWDHANPSRKVRILVQDVPLMKAWKSGSAITRDDEVKVWYYVGRLEEMWVNQRDVKDTDVKGEGPVTSTVTRVTVADTRRYITMRDMLVAIIENYDGSISDTEGRIELAEAILNEFTIEAPNT